MIDLGIGQPPPALLPADLLQQGAEERFRAGDRSWLQYGPEEGDGYFRLALAAFLSRAYETSVSAEALFITAGASQALYLMCTLFSSPGDVVLVEEPSYFLALRMFADHGLHVEGLATDAAGLDPDALEKRLRAGRAKKPAFLYVIPAFQNPTGHTLPAERRARLAELSEQYGLLVVADEVYQLLSYDASPPPPMPVWDRSGLIVSLGSFSKILAPGLRLGWIQAQGQVFARLVQSGLVKSGGGLNPFASAIVRGLLESGAQAAHIAWLRDEYRTRLAVMCASLEQHVGKLGRFSAPAGGYFVWLHLPGKDSEELLQQARQAGVSFHPGPLFSSNGGLRDYVRLCFAHYPPAALALAVERLATVMR